jgi:hypothetical protein
MKYVIAICLTFAAISSAFAAEMSHEETIVRTAYAKFAYASQQSVIGELALEANGKRIPQQYADMSKEERIAAAQITFTLSDFVVGDVRDVLKRKVTDFITPSDSEIIESSQRISSYTDADTGLVTHWNSINARWDKAHPIPPNIDALTVDDLYRLQWKQARPEGVWQSYAAYSVTVRFQGKTRGPYKALFLFGHDAQGKELVEPKDVIAGSVGLGQVLTQGLFPEGFVSSKLRTYQVVSDWVSANQVSNPRCAVGSGDVCCDLVKLQCGLERRDVAHALAIPVPSSER